jgi:hypothetical protein
MLFFTGKKGFKISPCQMDVRMIDYDNYVIERNRNRLISLGTFEIQKYCNKKGEEKL